MISMLPCKPVSFPPPGNMKFPDIFLSFFIFLGPIGSRSTDPVLIQIRNTAAITVLIDVGKNYSDSAWTQKLMTVKEFVRRYTKLLGYIRGLALLFRRLNFRWPMLWILNDSPVVSGALWRSRISRRIKIFIVLYILLQTSLIGL